MAQGIWPPREQFVRTEMLLGAAGMEKLKNAQVAVFGIGGVGGYVVEALARSGVGAFQLIDSDTVSLSNLNRQIIASRDTLGRPKTEVTRERILGINPGIRVSARNTFFLPENADEFDFAGYSYVVDAVDTVAAKICLALRAKDAGVPIISCMGTGNKLNPALLRVADLSETKVCPLARVMRRELKARGITHLKVVYSEEPPLRPIPEESLLCPAEGLTEGSGTEDRAGERTGIGCGSGEGRKKEPVRRAVPGSVSFVPSAAGLLIASEVVRDLAGR